MKVIKLGSECNLSILEEIVEMQKKGEQIVIVVGANEKLQQAQKEAGVVPKMITSEKGEVSRFTDRKTLKLLEKVYGEQVDNVMRIISSFNGSSARGFPFLSAKRHNKLRIVENGKLRVVDADLTGKIDFVDVELIEQLTKFYVLVFAPPISGLNVDGDKIASKIAVEMSADELIFHCKEEGLLKDFNEPKSLLKEVSISDAQKFADGRMKKKILSAKRARLAGVKVKIGKTTII